MIREKKPRSKTKEKKEQKEKFFGSNYSRTKLTTPDALTLHIPRFNSSKRNELIHLSILTCRYVDWKTKP